MLAHVRDADLKLFLDMSGAKRPAKPEDVAIATIAPAFMLSELRAGFQFDVPVRFDTDYLEVDLSAFAAGSVPRIPLVEIKL